MPMRIVGMGRAINQLLTFDFLSPATLTIRVIATHIEFDYLSPVRMRLFVEVIEDKVIRTITLT